MELILSQLDVLGSGLKVDYMEYCMFFIVNDDFC